MPWTTANKPAEILNREQDWDTLAKLASSARPELAFVTGRRRVGKSYVLARFARETGGIYYQATRRTEAVQLARLTRIVGEHFSDDALAENASFASWEGLLRYVIRRADREMLVLVIDEFPYLAGAVPALPSIIQSAWDHEWQNTKLKLVLSGSYISAMRRLEDADQPLYGRRTARLTFSPFTYRDVTHFVPSYDVRDQLRVYGIFGGLPGNLTLLDAAEGLEANVGRLVLEPSGRLVDDAARVLDAFLGEADIHYSIIEAVAQGQRTWSGITSRVGKASASVSRPLQWLQEMEIISRVVPITEKNPARSKRAMYRLRDPYLAFWHRFVAPLVQAGSIGLAASDELWKSAVGPYLDDYMGSVFEEICRDLARRPGVLPFNPIRVGEWWSSTSDDQIDVVAIGTDQELLVGEAKWGNITSDDLRTLRRRANLVAGELGNVTALHLAIFSGRSEVDGAVEDECERGGVLIFRVDDLA